MPARSVPLLAAATTAALAVLLTACGSGAGSPDTAAASAGEPQPGGELVFAVGSDQGCADPQQVGSNDSIFSLRQIVDSLTDQDPDTGEIVPWLAESWEPNAEATAWTFTLRDGVTFSDGTPLDSAAVAANFDRIPQIGVRGSLPKGYLAGYTGTTIVSPSQFTVNFSSPNVQFLQGTSTHSLGILSPASVALDDEARCTGVIGSGPFVLDSYTTNDSTVLTRRAGYAWGSSLWEHEGEAYLERAEFRVVPESGVRVGSLSAGEVNAIGNIGRQDESPLEAAGAQLLARSNPGIPFGFSVQHERVTDPAVRQAISLGVDRQQLVDTVYTSATVTATSPLASSTPLYAAQDITTDTARAGSVLDAAGWVPGADGIREKAGQRLSLQTFYYLNAGTNRPALELIQQQLRAIGIELVLNERPIADAQVVQESGEFDLSWGNLTRADADILRTQYSTTLTNYGRLPAGTPLDETLAAQAAAADPAARGELVARAQEQLTAGSHYIPVVELTTVLALGPEVQGLLYDASSRIQLHDTWISS